MTGRLPNFLVAGAAKSGTTSLCDYLRQHPDVFVARQKETHYFLFDGHPSTFRGPGDEKSFNSLLAANRADYLRCFHSVRGQQAVGESSVYYLYQPVSFARAVAEQPHMKFVVVLREPASRAYSAFSHHRRDAREPEEHFLAAVEKEPERKAAGWSYGFHYRSVGEYAGQLTEICRTTPADQLLILLYDDLVLEPLATVRRVYEFLEVDPTFKPDMSLRLNVSGLPRSQVLNDFLTQSNRGKDVVKRLLPYQAGNRLAHRIRNWNLRRTEARDAGLEELARWYESSNRALTDILDRELPPAWQR